MSDKSCGSKPIESHFGVGAPPILEPILVGGYGLLTHGHKNTARLDLARFDALLLFSDFPFQWKKAGIV